MKLNNEQNKIYMMICDIVDFNYDDKTSLKNRLFEYFENENEQLKEQPEQKSKIIKEAIFKTNVVKEYDFDKIGRYEILDILNKGVDDLTKANFVEKG